jgi:hypothetical protein
MRVGLLLLLLRHNWLQKLKGTVHTDYLTSLVILIRESLRCVFTYTESLTKQLEIESTEYVLTHVLLQCPTTSQQKFLQFEQVKSIRQYFTA